MIRMELTEQVSAIQSDFLVERTNDTSIRRPSNYLFKDHRILSIPTGRYWQV